MIPDGITADPHYFHPFVGKCFHIVAEAACLLGAPRSQVGGIEVDDDRLLAEVVRRLPRLALIVNALKNGSLVANFQINRRLISTAIAGDEEESAETQSRHQGAGSNEEFHILALLEVKSRHGLPPGQHALRIGTLLRRVN